MRIVCLIFALFFLCIMFCVIVAKEPGFSDIAKEYLSVTAAALCAFFIVVVVMPLFATVLLVPVFLVIFKEIKEAYNEATEYHRLSNLHDN